MASAATTQGFTPGQLRILKLAVVIMSLVLVIGLAAVVSRIVYLTARNPQAPPAIASKARLPLPQNTIVRSLSLSGDRLAVHYESSAGAGIAILDLSTGQPISHVDLRPAER